jgi:hypothetical protein
MSALARYSRLMPSSRVVSPSAACTACPTPRRASRRQACWYMGCIRQVSETPEKTRREPLQRPTALPPACAKRLSTASAASPVSRNRPMMALETASP